MLHTWVDYKNFAYNFSVYERRWKRIRYTESEKVRKNVTHALDIFGAVSPEIQDWDFRTLKSGTNFRYALPFEVLHNLFIVILKIVKDYMVPLFIWSISNWSQNKRKRRSYFRGEEAFIQNGSFMVLAFHLIIRKSLLKAVLRREEVSWNLNELLTKFRMRCVLDCKYF